ncbi:MAG TPA: restriction endonuclease [Verrucomicrobiae bacterium]|nr:restriction endonuclease [Verrucomicrobiae bacterium]
MNTVEKGDSFEERVYNAIADLLQNDGLGLSPKKCRLYRKRAYHSRDRGADIVVDISVEVWLPNSKQYSLLWVWECKDYSGSVPVNDVEEFYAKLQQIAGANVKGAMAISGAMQQSAFNFARSKGIAVVRLLPSDQVEWLIHLLTASMGSARLDPREFISAFTNPGHRGKPPELRSVRTVPRDVAPNFRVPIVAARLRPSIAAAAPVPEAAIHEDSKLALHEHEIRNAGQVFGIHTPAPKPSPN